MGNTNSSTNKTNTNAILTYPHQDMQVGCDKYTWKEAPSEESERGKITHGVNVRCIDVYEEREVDIMGEQYFVRDPNGVQELDAHPFPEVLPGMMSNLSRTSK